VISATRLAWLQLWREKLRLVIALLGVAFAVILIFMQLGFQDALFTSAVSVHTRLAGDIILVSPQSAYLASMKSFPRRRLHQARAFEGVESVAALYTILFAFKNPETGSARDIFVMGFDPSRRVLDNPEIEENRSLLRLPDVVLFDRASRPEYGPIAAQWGPDHPITTEVNQRKLTIRGLFTQGTSFGIDGTIVMSDQNFMRFFPHRTLGHVQIGLIKLKPGADVEKVRADLDTNLDPDVIVLTKQDYIDREKAYWNSATPIGTVFRFGVIMGLFVGAIIVYQILYADISDHLAEYATLKAMGYTGRYLVAVVLMEALILAIAGFLPGTAVSAWAYQLTAAQTNLPMRLTSVTSGLVFGLTCIMCWTSALIAVRKLSSADPAEIF
jgi:putative ABC transport system permease protein